MELAQLLKILVVRYDIIHLIIFVTNLSFRSSLCSSAKSVLLNFSRLVYLQLLTYGRRIPTAELFARIDAVDASTVKRVANKYLYDKVKLSLSLSSCLSLSIQSLKLKGDKRECFWDNMRRTLQSQPLVRSKICQTITSSDAEPTLTVTKPLK